MQASEAKNSIIYQMQFHKHKKSHNRALRELKRIKIEVTIIGAENE